jgi:flagellar basal-body rod modification protein FlgD
MSTVASLPSLANLQSNNSTSPTSTVPSQQLGEGDFMSLLMAQMKNQDPMSPMSNTDFVAQLAQFSQLNGITELNTSINNMMLMQGLTEGTNLIGKTVAYHQDAAGTSTATGKVGSVTVVSGEIQLVVDGKQVGLSQVSDVGA